MIRYFKQYVKLRKKASKTIVRFVNSHLSLEKLAGINNCKCQLFIIDEDVYSSTDLLIPHEMDHISNYGWQEARRVGKLYCNFLHRIHDSFRDSTFDLKLRTNENVWKTKKIIPFTYYVLLSLVLVNC